MTTTVADRLTNVETTEDPNALLGIDGIGQSPLNEITVTNNTDHQLEVTVTTSNFRIDNRGSDHEAFLSIGSGGDRFLQFAPENGNVDDVSFVGTMLEGGSATGTIQLQRTITISPEPATTYRIENAHSGLVLTARYAWNFDLGLHVNVQQNGWNQTPAQQWSIVDNGDGTRRIVNEQYGDALGVGNGSTSQGASVILREWNGADDRCWTMSPNADGSYRLINDNSGIAADVEGASTEGGANVIQWPWKGDDAVANQKWVFKPV